MIRVENLSKHFDGKAVLHDVSLEIRDGETFSIIGHSGSGKTVLMKHMVGLIRPDTGRILIDDTDIAQVSEDRLREIRTRFGFLFQHGALFDFMTTFENTAFPLRMFSEMTEDEIEARVRECLEMVELPDAGEKMPAELSGGQRKRVALARAIVRKPDYLFYDEPTSGLDPQTANTINDLIKNLSGRLGATSIVVTHDIHSVLSIADCVGFVHDGTLRFVGTIEEMRACEDAVLCDFVRANAYQI